MIDGAKQPGSFFAFIFALLLIVSTSAHAQRFNKKTIHDDLSFGHIVWAGNLLGGPALLAGRQAIQGPRDLLDYTLLTERFAHWEEWFARQGIGHHQAAHHIHFDYGFQTREAARQGLGMVLADQLEITGDVRRGSLVQPLEETLPMDAGIYLASDRPEEQTIRCRLFIEELLSYLASLGAELEQ